MTFLLLLPSFVIREGPNDALLFSCAGLRPPSVCLRFIPEPNRQRWLTTRQARHKDQADSGMLGHLTARYVWPLRKTRQSEQGCNTDQQLIGIRTMRLSRDRLRPRPCPWPMSGRRVMCQSFCIISSRIGRPLTRQGAARTKARVTWRRTHQ